MLYFVGNEGRKDNHVVNQKCYSSVHSLFHNFFEFSLNKKMLSVFGESGARVSKFIKNAIFV